MKCAPQHLTLEPVDEASKGGGACDWLERAWEQGAEQLGECGGVSNTCGRGGGYSNGVKDDCAVRADVAASLVAEGVEVAIVIAACRIHTASCLSNI